MEQVYEEAQSSGKPATVYLGLVGLDLSGILGDPTTTCPEQEILFRSGSSPPGMYTYRIFFRREMMFGWTERYHNGYHNE